MHKKLTGIIISEYPYEESSKIINVFTKDGVIGVLAKGAKKIKSPFFCITSKLTLCSFNIISKSSSLNTLIDGDIIENFKNIKKDIEKVSYATYLTELVTRVYKHENNRNIYELYVSSLIKINEGFDPLIITNIIELKLLDYLGIKPVIDSCTECGSTHDIVTVSSYLGGFVCKNCLRNEKLVSSKTIKLIRMFYYVDISKISKVEISEEIKKEINEFIEDYYDRYSGIYLKSKTLLDKLNKI